MTARDVDQVLQAGVLGANAQLAGDQTRQAALSAIDSVLGAPGSGTDLASLLGRVQGAFTTLADDPGNQTQQQAVVSSAATLTAGINALWQAYAGQRQGAQDAIVGQVATLNSSIATIGALGRQIVTLKAQGLSTADLENQRDAAINTLSQATGVRVLGQPSGDVTIVTDGGLLVPIHGTTPPFATAPANLGASSAYPAGGVPAIMLGGTDVTAQLAAGGGRLGADIVLRDDTLPTGQAELDAFSHSLATRFAAQGLTLFTQPDGTVPVATGPLAQSGYIGFAATIGVNPAVVANPAAVRDGTNDVAGSAGGASAFTINPAGGPAGFTGLVSRVLDYALGSDAQAGVPQPAPNVSGLGPAGTLGAPYAAPPDLAGLASALVGAQAQVSAAATDQAAASSALQTSLTTKLGSETGVNLDTELADMTQLQNAYGANAKVLTAVQALYAALLAAVAP